MVSNDIIARAAYYRRGSAELALGHHKKAVKDFKLVVRMKPQDKDARAKLKLCEKIIKEAAFAAAIQSERNLPLSETIDVNGIGNCLMCTFSFPHAGSNPFLFLFVS